MISGGILGSTIFDEIQIICELALFLLLIYGIVKKIKLKNSEIILVFVLLITSIISLWFTDFFSFALDFKLYGLCILTFIYFRRINFNPSKLILIVLMLNIGLILHQLISGHFIVQSAWFIGQYKRYANDRPIGIFLTPHASSFFLAIYIIYIIKAKSEFFKGLICFVVTLITLSFTNVLALLAQLSGQFFKFIFKKFTFLGINFASLTTVIIIIIPIFLLSRFRNEFVELMTFSSYTRWHTLAVELNQMFDMRYYSDIFKLYMRNYVDFTVGQEQSFAEYGNELGLIKIFVEGGFVLGSIVLIMLIRNLKYYRIFIFVSLMHYSYIVNMPFLLFLMLIYNREMTNKDECQKSSFRNKESRKVPIAQINDT